MARSFKITDIAALKNYQENYSFHNHAHTYTWGQSLIRLGAVFSPFADSFGMLTAIEYDNSTNIPAIAQVVHHSGERLAKLNFFSPVSAIDSPVFGNLIDFLISKLGERKAQSLMAEVSEDSSTIEAFQKENFHIHARQQVWLVKSKPKLEENEIRCHWMAGLDALHVNSIYTKIVPKFNQSIDFENY